MDKTFTKMTVAGCLLAASVSVHAALDDKAALQLMNKAQCAACHTLDKKGVGPAYLEVAKKRKSEKDAVAMLVKKVREGGTGVYGPIPMPPNPKANISDDDIKLMVEWILSK